MANRQGRGPAQTIDVGLYNLAGQVQIAADGSVSKSTIPFVSAAKTTGNGRYTLTLADSWPTLRACGITFDAQGSAARLRHCIVSSDVTTARTIVIELSIADGTATTPSALCALHFNIVVKNSTV